MSEVTQKKRTPAEDKRDRDRKAAVRKEAKRAYAARKKKIAELEQTNDRYVYIFRSDDEDWCKIGWNSLLLYRYVIAKRLKKKVSVRNDGDFGLKSPTGIVSLRVEHLDKLFSDLVPLKMFKDQAKTVNREIWVINLGYKVEEEEFERFRQLEKIKKERLNTLVPVAIAIPEIETPLVHIAQTIEIIVRRSPQYERDMYIYEMWEEIHSAMKIYRRMTWGATTPEVALKKIYQHVCRIMIEVSVAGRMDIVDLDTATKLATQLGDAKNLLRSKLGLPKPMADEDVKNNQKERENGSKTVGDPSAENGDN